MVKELLKQNAHVEAKDKYGFTPLIRGIFLYYLINSNYLLFLIYSFRERPH